MREYISKSALVAEIERRLVEDYNTDDVEMDEVAQGVLASLMFFIDTLEVKEVDLEKEVNAYMVNEMKFLSDEVGYDTLLAIAKHFFELGMSVSNKAQKGE